MKTRIEGLPAGLEPSPATHDIVFREMEYDDTGYPTAVFDYVPPAVEQPEAPGAFDRKAAAWVRRHYPGSTPEVGTVSFDVEAAAYQSGAWCRFDVSWFEEQQYVTQAGEVLPAGGRHVHKTIEESAWDYSATDLMRELTEMEDPGDS